MNWKENLDTARRVLAHSPLALVLGFALVPRVHSQTFTDLYSFSGNDGATPWGHIIVDETGKVWGTTAFGGDLNCTIDGGGCGTIFTLDATGTETVLHNFEGSDGQSPYGGLTPDGRGGFVGTTSQGGSFGNGVIFRIDSAGSFRVIYNFRGGADGAGPQAALIRDGAGFFYGTTSTGGTNNVGTVFKLNLSGAETVLYAFTGGPDGRGPASRLLRDRQGNLYGTASSGGDTTCGFGLGCGTVFELASSGNLRVIHTFEGGKQDGNFPDSGLIVGFDASIYGTTSGGGGGKCTGGPDGDGCGTIFRIARGGKYSVIYKFTGGEDGATPDTELVAGLSGILYGAAAEGGPTCGSVRGCGTVFQTNNIGAFKVLHGFTDGPDGGTPHGLVRTQAGVLYGTAAGGGERGDGVIFKVVP
jgi:uncharacterized repeat protein (TIGR03803 family)